MIVCFLVSQVDEPFPLLVAINGTVSSFFILPVTNNDKISLNSVSVFSRFVSSKEQQVTEYRNALF